MSAAALAWLMAACHSACIVGGWHEGIYRDRDKVCLCADPIPTHRLLTPRLKLPQRAKGAQTNPTED